MTNRLHTSADTLETKQSCRQERVGGDVTTTVETW